MHYRENEPEDIRF